MLALLTDVGAEVVCHDQTTNAFGVAVARSADLDALVTDEHQPIVVALGVTHHLRWCASEYPSCCVERDFKSVELHLSIPLDQKLPPYGTKDDGPVRGYRPIFDAGASGRCRGRSARDPSGH